MRLDELFGMDDDDGMTVSQRLQQTALSVIIPMLAHNVPFVTVQSIMDELRSTRPGIFVDRALIMDLLDPDKVKAVTKIEGDRIYLQAPEEDEHKAGEDETAKDVDKIKKNAIQQAKKDTTAPATPTTAPSPPAPAPTNQQ